MGKNKKLSIAIWMLAFILSIFLLLIIPDNYDNHIWVTLIFTIITYVSQLVLWLLLSRNGKNAESFFYITPALVVSTIYMILQLILCVITAAFNNFISVKGIVIINFVMLIVIWIVLLVLILAKDQAKKVDLRQKDHHIKL